MGLSYFSLLPGGQLRLFPKVGVIFNEALLEFFSKVVVLDVVETQGFHLSF
jgi:hypothetical protein